MAVPCVVVAHVGHNSQGQRSRPGCRRGFVVLSFCCVVGRLDFRSCRLGLPLLAVFAFEESRFSQIFRLPAGERYHLGNKLGFFAAELTTELVCPPTNVYRKTHEGSSSPVICALLSFPIASLGPQARSLFTHIDKPFASLASSGNISSEAWTASEVTGSTLVGWPASFRVARICWAKAAQYASKGSRSSRLNSSEQPLKKLRRVSDTVLTRQSTILLGIVLPSAVNF